MPVIHADTLDLTLAVLTLKPWDQLLLETFGHHCHSTYVETFWLPTLGPSAFLVGRCITTQFEKQGSPITIGADQLSGWCGISAGQLNRSIERLSKFGLARIETDATLIRAWWPTAPHVTLPPDLKQAHGDFQVLTDIDRPELVADRAMWRRTVRAHSEGKSGYELDQLLRHHNCRQDLRVQLVSWLTSTPRFGKAARH
jgi:hypothetical protein